MARKYNTTYRTYKKRYYEQARKVERQKRAYQMSKTKKELIQERQAIKNARPLTKAESKYYRDEIRKNTLTKEARRKIKLDVSKLKTKDLALRDSLLDKPSFNATYKDIQRELEKDPAIQGHVDPMQYLVRQQAYAVSDKQYQALKNAIEEYGERPYYSDDVYDENGEIEEAFYPFREDIDLSSISEFAIRTGEIGLSDLMDYERMGQDYHRFADFYKEHGFSNWREKASEKIAQLYWKSA